MGVNEDQMRKDYERLDNLQEHQEREQDLHQLRRTGEKGETMSKREPTQARVYVVVKVEYDDSGDAFEQLTEMGEQVFLARDEGCIEKALAFADKLTRGPKQ